MELFIRNMNKRMANDILNWKYDKPYDFYNNEVTDESMKEILDGSYYALVDEFKELIGFFCVGKNAQVPIGNRFGVYTEDLVDILFQARYSSLYSKLIFFPTWSNLVWIIHILFQ